MKPRVGETVFRERNGIIACVGLLFVRACLCAYFDAHPDGAQRLILEISFDNVSDYHNYREYCPDLIVLETMSGSV